MGGGDRNACISAYGRTRTVSSSGVPKRRSGAIAFSPAAGSPDQHTPTPNAGPVASGRTPAMVVRSSGAVLTTSR
jgi:hypothetical protein